MQLIQLNNIQFKKFVFLNIIIDKNKNWITIEWHKCNWFNSINFYDNT